MVSNSNSPFVETCLSSSYLKSRMATLNFNFKMFLLILQSIVWCNECINLMKCPAVKFIDHLVCKIDVLIINIESKKIIVSLILKIVGANCLFKIISSFKK